MHESDKNDVQCKKSVNPEANSKFVPFYSRPENKKKVLKMRYVHT